MSTCAANGGTILFQSDKFYHVLEIGTMVNFITFYHGLSVCQNFFSFWNVIDFDQLKLLPKFLT